MLPRSGVRCRRRRTLWRRSRRRPGRRCMGRCPRTRISGTCPGGRRRSCRRQCPDQFRRGHPREGPQRREVDRAVGCTVGAGLLRNQSGEVAELVGGRRLLCVRSVRLRLTGLAFAGCRDLRGAGDSNGDVVPRLHGGLRPCGELGFALLSVLGRVPSALFGSRDSLARSACSDWRSPSAARSASERA